jgi:O-succinylbenzoic acid--CoA ligase
MSKDEIPFHTSFKLNGISYSKSELLLFASELVKLTESFQKEIGEFLLAWLNDAALIEVKTSGSTGSPKLISLRKQYMVNSAIATGQFFDLKEGDSALLCLSAAYIAGKMMLVRAMILGLELDYIQSSSEPLSTTSKYYDFCAMVPLQVQNSIDQLKRIKTLIVGGAPMSYELKGKLKEVSTMIFETYGMTETITHVAVKQINNIDFAQLGNKQNTFVALPNISFYIDDRNCLCIKAPKISDASIITNDVVELRSESEFHWLGRFDNVINSGGVKLHPEVIEEKLSSFLENRFFVAGLPDIKFGERLVLVVEGLISNEQLLEQIKLDSTFSPFEIPKNIFVLPNFLETETGKIHRIKNLLRVKG